MMFSVTQSYLLVSVRAVVVAGALAVGSVFFWFGMLNALDKELEAREKRGEISRYMQCDRHYTPGLCDDEVQP